MSSVVRAEQLCPACRRYRLWPAEFYQRVGLGKKGRALTKTCQDCRSKRRRKKKS